MKIRKIIMGFILTLIIVLTVACGSGNTREGMDTVLPSEEDLKKSIDTEPSSEEETATEDNFNRAPDEIETATLETIAELLGKSDLQAAEMFGGGKENWTEDRAFYIGRIYQVNLFDKEVSVYTSYDEKQLVNSISVWLVNGESMVMEEDTLRWVERLEEFTGTKPTFYDTASEGGSKNWKWYLGDRAFTLNWMENILTISMNVVVGELD